MPWPTVEEVAEYLDQVELDTPTETRLQRILDRARSIVEEQLEPIVFTDAWADTPTTKTVRGRHSAFLELPAHKIGSVSAVALSDGTILPSTSWSETDEGYLYAEPQSGLYSSWALAPYDVTAIYGWGPVPAAVAEIVIEVAINVWRQKAQGLFVEIQGREGGAGLRYIGMLTSQQRATLEQIKQNREEIVI